MKTDKILFGVACITMGYLLSNVANKPNENFSVKRGKTVLSDSVKMSAPLAKDTVMFSDIVKKDTINAIKKVVK